MLNREPIRLFPAHSFFPVPLNVDTEVLLKKITPSLNLLRHEVYIAILGIRREKERDFFIGI